MKHQFIVEIEVDDTEFALHQAKRKQRHLFHRSLNDHVEILVCDAIKSTLFPQVSCKPLERSQLREAVDSDATL